MLRDAAEKTLFFGAHFAEPLFHVPRYRVHVVAAGRCRFDVKPLDEVLGIVHSPLRSTSMNNGAIFRRLVAVADTPDTSLVALSGADDDAEKLNYATEGCGA